MPNSKLSISLEREKKFAKKVAKKNAKKKLVEMPGIEPGS